MTPYWLGWGIVGSGLTAAYFWKQSHPGESLNPMPPTVNGEGNMNQLQHVQHTLNCLLGAHLPEDGKMGPNTVRAIKHFQARVGLKPDGKCGPKTLKALHETALRMRLHALPLPTGQHNLVVGMCHGFG